MTDATPTPASNHLPEQVSELFDPVQWRTVEGFQDLQDLTYHRGVERDDDGFHDPDTGTHP